MRRIAAFLISLLGNVAYGQTLDFPRNATLTAETIERDNSYSFVRGVWGGDGVPVATVEGRVVQQAWRIDANALTTLQLARPLREQLLNDQYRIIFECETDACGGFDFRFAVESLPPPQMRISLGDFRYIAAEKTGGDAPEYLALFISRTDQAGFVQVTHIGPAATPVSQPIATAQATTIRMINQPADIGFDMQLEQNGSAVLTDLAFTTGSAQLAPIRFASLTALAGYLSINPDRKVALVGHTDTAGALAANITLSKRRAASVLERLVSDYGANRQQLTAEGMGYLAPIANNGTEAGREINRRVEVVITSHSE